MSDSNIPLRSPKTSMVLSKEDSVGANTSITSPIMITKLPHELAADIQDCISVTSNAIDGLIQLGSASGLYEVALWLSNHAYVGFQTLSMAMSDTSISTELKTLSRDSEKVCTLISVSSSVENEEAEELLRIANELLAESSNKTLHVFAILNRGFETEVQL